MKFKILKKENRKGGFALLFSVLVSSLLLTIGLSIFNIAIKELAISTASRQSIYAFYAADSGRECIKYWDTKKEMIPDLFSDKTGSITCGGRTINLSNVSYSTELYKYSDPTVNLTIDSDESPLFNDDDGPSFKIHIYKEITDRNLATQRASTTIISYGHDSSGSDRIERAIQQTY